MSRDPNELSPKTLELYNAFKQKMDQYGYKFILTATYRSQVEQDALYAQGRLTLKEVNGYRVLAGLDSITFQQNRKVTWVKKSRHTDRDAFDIAMLDKDGKVTWKNSAYNPAGKIGKEVGLVWGGDFKDLKGNPMADMPHFELP
jgi:peptidoglycan L-alanyl-D-glutamate endopeptidase CwlK